MNMMLDAGMWEIEYREPILGGNRRYLAKVATLMDAVASFNLHKGGFDTPLSIKRIDINGLMSDRWTMQGRYAVPQHVTKVRNGRYDTPKATRRSYL